MRRAILFFSVVFVVGLPFTNAQVSINMLIVGGGGGGGRNAGSNSSGGGGAGGGQVVYATTSGTAGSAFTIVVGAGGNGFRFSPAVTQTNGGSSSITDASSTWSALGGNAGGDATDGSSSGSGGTSVNSDGSGAGGRGGIYDNGNDASGWPVAGGNGTSAYSAWGEATGTGELSGSTRYYGGGGAGGNWGGQSGGGNAAAGLGGGGRSNSDATANTGGGGGGANSNGSSGMNLPGGNGGAGLVILSYAGTPVASGGTITQSGGNTYHTFTSSGILMINSTLPITWQAFTAENRTGLILLKWTVSDEINDLRYEIERSPNGSNFQTIASVTAENSLNSIQYSYADKSPLNSRAYYRIKQVDIDGRSSFSKTVSIDAEIASSIRLFPNPAHDNLTISMPSTLTGTYMCTIYTASGEKLASRELIAGTNNIGMQSMKNGLYFISIWADGVCIHVEKVTK